MDTLVSGAPKFMAGTVPGQSLDTLDGYVTGTLWVGLVFLMYEPTETI